MITNDVDEAILVADRMVPLNPGPNACLGPAFTVGLQRPRNKTELNHDEPFKQLHNTVTNYLVAVRQKSRRDQAAISQAPVVNRPDIKPADLSLPRKASLKCSVGFQPVMVRTQAGSLCHTFFVFQFSDRSS